MSNKKNEIHLSTTQRAELNELVRNGQAPAKKITHARILLMSDQHHPDERWTDADISRALQTHINTIARIRKRFVQHGQAPALERKPRTAPARPAIFDGEKEAQLIAICCQQAPQGRAKWSLSLLVSELKQRGIVTEVCRETVRQTLKKTSFNLGATNVSASQRKTQHDSAHKWRTSSSFTLRKTPKKNL
jgi:transposase